MQLVPYMPIHPAQLNEEKPIESQTSISVTSDEPKNDNHLFKIPSVPTFYTVEEPPSDDVMRRNPTMKR